MGTRKVALRETFISEIRSIIVTARQYAVSSVDRERVLMYWKLGERIFNEEQQGEDRAAYGSALVANLAIKMEAEFGSGFSARQLERARQFYRTYPIPSAVRTQFNWLQYKLLIHIEDPDRREYYELEAINNHWTGTQQ